MSVEGVRVVRGPHWKSGDDDGGEGHVGTVTQDNEDDTVEVQWDMGKSDTYNTGNGGKCDLSVLDSAPAGLKHTGIVCDGCMVKAFTGTRWKCGTCSDFDLCTVCYFHDKHDIQHPFIRHDFPGCTGVKVPKRSGSRKVAAMGIFKGATVRRGEDWSAGNQDGGDGNTGKVTEVRSYGSSGAERDSVTVKWPDNDGVYRLGYRGKVDLECVKAASGLNYYKDHLYAMNTNRMKKPTNPQASVMSLTREKTTVRQSIQPGDMVCVALPEMALKEVQRGHGGWNMRMKEYIGQHGKVKSFADNGDINVVFGDKEYKFNPEAVMKVPSLKVGDMVKILDNENKVQVMQHRHGGWQSEMAAVIGKVGKIVKIDSDGDVAVAFGTKAWVFNPVCCLFAPGEEMFQLTKSGDGGRPGAGGSSDDEDDEDEGAVGLAHLIAQMILLRELGKASIGPQNLVAAAAKNDIETVTRILKDKPSLLNEKHQGLTPLIIASHEGHFDTVVVLLNAKADTNLTEPKGNNALMAACMKKHEKIALLLIKIGTNIETANNSQLTALHLAALNGCVKVIKELLRLGANSNSQDSDGDTPLHIAVQVNSGIIVLLFLADSKTQLTLKNKHGHTPLLIAAMKGHPSLVKLILQKCPELIDAKKDDGYTPLHVAAVNDNTDVIKTLLELKATVDSLERNKATPLHLAAHQGYLESTKLLVQASANVNQQTDDGNTPLHMCVGGQRRGGNTDELARRLFGIRVNSDAEVKDRTNVACFLIQNGASVDIRNKQNRDVLRSCKDTRMQNAIRMFAEKHGRPSSARPGTRQPAQPTLFSDVPIPCMGCLLKMADVKFGPCGHQVCCRQCSFKVRDCPLCDSPINNRFANGGEEAETVVDCRVQ